MKIKFKVLLIFALTAIQFSVFAQFRGEKKPTPAEIAALKKAVDLNPLNEDVHEKYLMAVRIDSPAVLKYYKGLLTKYPKSALLNFVIGKAYGEAELPEGKSYLLKAVALDPKMAKAYFWLSMDADRWGDKKGSTSYMKKAADLEPDSADYAYYYSSDFAKTDWNKYLELTNDLIKRFPKSERGAQALYWMADANKTIEDKVATYERLKATYLPADYNWSMGGMMSYFNLMLFENPNKAISIANEMLLDKRSEREWTPYLKAAKEISQATKLIESGQSVQGLALLDTLKFPRRMKNDLPLLRAKALSHGGDIIAAYDSLMVAFVRSPRAKYFNEIKSYGKQLNKSSDQIEGDIWAGLDKKAKVATDFTLKQYLKPGNASLADYKGKVVLLTYWFPGCGPCRAEFPHFENVLKKFDPQQVQYLGINILKSQNDYVLPFMKSTGFTFTPLEDFSGRVKGNLDNKGGAPANFLIDKEGRIIFEKFRTDAGNEEDLEMMISLLSNKKA